MSTVDLNIGVITCACCATRVERRLNRMPGVAASVNLATEPAHVSYPSGVLVADLVRTVETTGYTASEKRAPEPSLAPRLVVSAALTIALMVLGHGWPALA